MPSPGRTAGVAVVAAMSLTGCLGTDGDAAQPARGTGARPPSGTIGTADPDKVIARQTFGSPIADGATLEIGIIELKVSGRLAHLTLVLTPRNAGSDQVSVSQLNGRSAPDVALLDTVNLKRYRVVRAGSRQLQPHYIFDKVRNNRPNVQTYTFAAPPESVRAVDVSFGQWAPFRNVPVTR
ncbi:hypothetical protein [Actinomadura sp. 21ATH]|uniref:hypothetical protein n=1 Tax=Actinomadura sp. 21ATH TaxID=1735444 RepID=UPI0035BED432